MSDITLLNPKINIAIIITCLAELVIALSANKYSIVAFSIGFAAGMPIALQLWNTIDSNWKNFYRKFYSTPINKRSHKLYSESWKHTWWLVPLSFLIYAPISFGIMRYSNDPSLLLACIFGSIAATTWVGSKRGEKFFKDLEK